MMMMVIQWACFFLVSSNSSLETLHSETSGGKLIQASGAVTLLPRIYYLQYNGLIIGFPDSLEVAYLQDPSDLG